MRKLLSGIASAVILLSTLNSGFITPVFAETGNTLIINEIMAANSTIRDGDIDDPEEGSKGGAYSDWIEIYNNGTSAVDLNNYSISDSKSTFIIPQISVPSKGFLVIWASGKDKVTPDGQLHTNFEIKASGEAVTLKNPEGTVVDSVTTVSLQDNFSYGRKTDGEAEFVVFSKATPGSTNQNGIIPIVEPIFSHIGGFYTGQFNLQISTTEPGAEIYYTTNGSDPIPGASGTQIYTEGIPIKSRVGEPNEYVPLAPGYGPEKEAFKCSIIKAIAVRTDDARVRSSIVTKSYFVDPNVTSKFGNLPVISLITDKANLFDYTTGLFTNYDKEYPIHLEFFEKDGTPGFSKYCGITIHGNTSTGFPQKSLRLYADRELDDSNKIKYDIFPAIKDANGDEVFPALKNISGENLTSFGRLILRNSGQDWTRTMYRDALMHSLASQMNIDTQAYRPAVAFINGEYWGIYNIRERYDNKYFASHYNLDKDKVALLAIEEGGAKVEAKEGGNEDVEAYNEIVDYIISQGNNIANDDVYNNIKTKIDIDSFIDYYVAIIYYDNHDLSNNINVWKYKTDDNQYHPEAPLGQDGRWRWALRDTDYGFEHNFDTSNTNPDYQKTFADNDLLGYLSGEDVFLLKALIKNPEFREKFINRFADHLNTTFTPDRVKKGIDSIKNMLEPAMQDHIDRWHGIKSMDSWTTNVGVLSDFADKRPGFVRQHIIDNFAGYVTGTADITLNTDTSKGSVKVNSIDIKNTTPGVTNAENWSGTYFTGIPVTLKAVPLEGYRVKWNGIDEILSDANTIQTVDSITFTLKNNINVSATFEKYGDLDRDGNVDSTDGYILKRHVLDISELPQDLYGVADLDLDGNIDSTDYYILKRYLLGVITTLPYIN